MPADPQIIASVFRRHGAESHRTRLFEDFSARVQADILAEAAPGRDEEPVIACYENTANWFLITTRRLVWRTVDSLDSIKILELDRVDFSFDPAIKRWQKAGLPPDRNPKAEIDDLPLVALDGRRATVVVERGAPFYALLNTIMWLCRWAESQRAKAMKAESNE